MNVALWMDILADVQAAERHFAAAGQLLAEGDLDDQGLAGYRAQMALMHAMQSGHTSAEAALKRVLAVLGEPLPVGSDWHADIIARLAAPIAGVRAPALSLALAEALQETRRFRHVAMHIYDGFRTEGADKAVAAAQKVVALLRTDLAAFRATLQD